MQLNRLLHSSIFRLALVYLSLFSASVLILVAVIYWFTTESLTRQIDATIDAEIKGLSEQFDQRGLLGLIWAIQRRSEGAEETRGLYLLTDRDFAPLAGNMKAWPEQVSEEDGWVTFQLNYKESDQAGINLGRGRTFDLGGWYHLLVGYDIRERLFVASMIRESLIWGIVVVIALSVLGGLFLSRKLLNQVDAINLTSREIMAGDLTQRVPLSGRNDEFDQLAGNLNAMLDKIEALLTSVRQVSDNIAHDLRSPLTRLRSRLEVTLLDPPQDETYKEAIEQTIAEADQLLETFNALLNIAQVEAGVMRKSFAPVDLGALIDDLAELYEPVAEERDLTFEASHTIDATLPGERELLFQAVANLLDNAFKFSPEGAKVSLVLQARDGHPAIIVADSGPGIPAAARERVRERFFRLEESRSTPGSGLGLSLVSAVAALHRGRLELEDNAPGLKAVLIFSPRGQVD